MNPGPFGAGAVREFRFDAGSLSLNLVATVGRRFGEPVERLDSLDRLDEWLAGVGFDVRGRRSDDDLAMALALREDLDELFRSALASKRLPASALNRVNAAAAVVVPQLCAAVRSGTLAPAVSGRPVLGPVLALTACDAIRVLSSGERAGLRCCEADDCRMLYLANGRRARRWCSSERCGNRSRVASHRARAVDRR